MSQLSTRALASILALCFPAAASTSRAQEAPGRPPIVIAYAIADTTDPRFRAFDHGVRFGIAEAKHAAALLGRPLAIVEIGRPADVGQAPDPTSARAIADRPDALDVDVMIVPSLATPSERLTQWLSSGRAIIVSSMFPLSPCELPIFRVGPDNATRAAVIARDSASRSTAQGGASPAVVLWHHELERFGARQLSDRYAQQRHGPMTSEAWEGWMAVKIAWESALRARNGDVATAIAGGAFDGHKGAALRFDASDRILRQPLIVVVPRSSSPDPTADASATRVLREVAWPAQSTDAPTRTSGAGDRCSR